jgi:outer membrane protein assembly factor BamE (lipoprotein component of BamABCDE complex)
MILRALGMTPVEVWVAMGTPAIRENVYDRTWIDYVLQTDHDCDLLIVPDVRFPNEATEFKLIGGTRSQTKHSWATPAGI